MPHHSSYHLTESERRIRNGLRIGIVQEADYSGKIPRYRVQELADEQSTLTTGWVHALNVRAGGDREADFYEIGEQVGFMMIAGSDTYGYIIGSMPQDKYPSPEDTAERHARHYKDGAIIRYDREKHHYEINLPPDATVDIIATGGVFIDAEKGGLEVDAKTGGVSVDATNGGVEIDAKSGGVSIDASSGKVNVKGDVIVQNGDVIADGISLKKHIHSGVYSGPSVTGKPVG